MSSKGEWREYIPRDGDVVWAEGAKRMVCKGWVGIECRCVEKKLNATNPKSVKGVDALHKADG